MWNFEDNLSAKGIIFRYTSKPETGYLFYNPLINFFISNMFGEKEKQKQVVSARANDANKHIDWLIFYYYYYWNCDWTRAWQAVVSKELSQRPRDQNSKKGALLVYILPTALFEKYSKNRF